MSMRGGCCCCSGGSGGHGSNSAASTTSEQLGRLTTIVNTPPATVNDPIIVKVGGYSDQPVYFSVTKPPANPNFPKAMITMINPTTGTEEPYGSIETTSTKSSGSLTISNGTGGEVTYKINVFYNAAERFTSMVNFMYPADYHDYDGYYMRGGANAIVAVH